MATEQFRTINFRADTREKIDRANAIISEYGGQKLTARQIYYQFVSRDWLANTVKNYKMLTSVLTDGRYNGDIDWDAIEDRGREPDSPGDWKHINNILDAAVHSFKLPRWRNQEYYVEVWVEKMALAGVLAPITHKHHVTLMVNKGYSSASAMYESAQRMMSEINAADDDEADKLLDLYGRDTKIPVVLYLGDHDPSGKDMVRDIEARLTEFGVPDLEVCSVALTTAQVKKHKPPPNPAKLTDSRAKAYIAEFGPHSWELDALPPRELNQIVEDAIAERKDQALFDAVIQEEERQRTKVRAMMKAIK